MLRWLGGVTDRDGARVLAACAPEQLATGTGVWSGELLPYCVAAEQPSDEPLRPETCPLAYASDSATAAVHGRLKPPLTDASLPIPLRVVRTQIHL
jgi:hypothetical protein